jgi:hypothetical protein
MESAREVLQKDHDYWTRYVQPMIGDWLNANTTFVEIAAFAQKVHVEPRPQRIQRGFKICSKPTDAEIIL